MDGVFCVKCVQTIGTALAALPGVVSASANLVGNVTVVLSDDDDELRSEVRRRLLEAGFPPVDA